METDGHTYRARRNIVRSTEGRKEIVKRVFIGQINNRQTGTPLILVALENVVVPNGNIEEIAGCDAGRIVVVVLGARQQGFS